ncbi:NAD(P)/FAD-dependent oxidoreductase [Glycomyces terrestris]|uniref:FAD-dependent oxidoreductase n=1 Tax=Glycomyces terrestris TaxID=2493553 RepID=A0A426V3A8_9ACTN|nr:FAD-dependent oxidoreductase [Glycomyces terrestris]RRS01320.1 FAD-dependent oxidoreductase [Glycomyces terrestris]
MNGNTRVVVLGGGYAGVMAANRLMRRSDLNVTIVNPRKDFVERMRLHRLAARSGEAVLDFAAVLNPDVRLLVDAATAIDPGPRTVALRSGAALAYDYLVYAVGSGSPEPKTPGAAEHAYTMDTLEEALVLRTALDDTAASRPVTVVGSGPTGIEVAAEIAEAGRPVTLVCGAAFAPYLHPRARRSVAKGLARLGVTVIEGPDARAVEVTGDAVRLGDGRELASAVTVWTAGFGVPDLAARSGLRTDGAGRLVTDETLTSVDDRRIVAAGDSAAPSGLALRMCSQAAFPLGAHAADTVLARIAGEEPATIDIGLPAVCTSLGQRNATMQFLSADGTATSLYIGGRFGSRLKEMSYPHVIERLAREAREPGRFEWKPKDALRPKLLAELDHAASQAA